MIIAALAAMGAGVVSGGLPVKTFLAFASASMLTTGAFKTLPLMNVVFGEMHTFEAMGISCSSLSTRIACW